MLFVDDGGPPAFTVNNKETESSKPRYDEFYSILVHVCMITVPRFDCPCVPSIEGGEANLPMRRCRCRFDSSETCGLDLTTILQMSTAAYVQLARAADDYKCIYMESQLHLAWPGGLSEMGWTRGSEASGVGISKVSCFRRFVNRGHDMI